MVIYISLLNIITLNPKNKGQIKFSYKIGCNIRLQPYSIK